MLGSFLGDERGQIVIWVGLSLLLLVVFVGMAVDMGVIYMQKAKLANSVDAAVITGVKDYASQGQQGAQNLATDMFQANYGSSAPTVTYEWCPNAMDPNCGTSLSLTAHATDTVPTRFLQVLPQLAQWQIGATSTATRSNLVMTIVLDRSASMCGGTIVCPPYITDGGDSGGQALQSAVPSFVNNFVTGVDYLGVVSFAANGTVDVPITSNFKTAINNDVATMTFQGDTFGTGAGTNTCTGTCLTYDGPPLNMADNQNNSVSFGAGQPETKVVVYFTDGLMNTIQDTFHCGGAGSATLTLLNYGGLDASEMSSCPGGLILDPTQPFNPYGCAFKDNYGNPINGFYYNSYQQVCTDASNNPVTTFPSQKYGTQETLSQTSITEETQWRAIKTANNMRSETPVPTYIFVIGLGHAVSGSVPTEAFLSTLANDPNGPGNYTGAVYNSSLPAGLFVVVPDCPSSACTQELTTAFQTIAAKILLRLTQ
jgi:Flp pilus assembly protein TadG